MPTDPWGNLGGQTKPLERQAGFAFAPLADMINDLTNQVKQKIVDMRENQDTMSIADMFDLQMAMNKLSQMSELSTTVLAEANKAISRILQNM